jgi:hypothetical protein
MVQDGNADHEIHRTARQRQIVRRAGHELAPPLQAIQRESLAREVQERTGDVQADHARTPAREQNAVFPIAAPEIEHDLAGHVTEQVKRILERKRGRGGRIHIAANVRFAGAQPLEGRVRCLRMAPLDLRVFPRTNIRDVCH